MIVVPGCWRVKFASRETTVPFLKDSFGGEPQSQCAKPLDVDIVE